MILASFSAFLLLFLAIGLSSAARSRGNAEDYLIAGKAVSPLLVGLSAIATNNSGFMFIGMVGYTYAEGLASLWLMIGWILGDFAASMIAVRRIQAVSRRREICSFGDLVSRWHGQDYRVLRVLAGLLTVSLLCIYAAAQFKAGSKATGSILGWAPDTGIWISAGIVLLYSFFGGIRASIWTDVAQSVVMVLGMGVLLYAGLNATGGMTDALMRLEAVGPGYMTVMPRDGGAGAWLFIAGWLFGGLSVIGQPHIVIRFMSLDSQSHVTRMRFYYYSWFVLFYGMTIAVGLLSRLVIPPSAGFDAEVALPVMAQSLLSPWFVGLVLAAMFAATMSTADSLVLACSAALSRDLVRGGGWSLPAVKAGTVLVLASALAIALSGSQTVFALVLDAWGLLASAFVPLVLVQAGGRRPSETITVLMVIAGVTVFIAWQQLGLETVTYAAAPGIVTGLLVYVLSARREDTLRDY